MAIAVTTQMEAQVMGPGVKRIEIEATLDDSYPTGGYDISSYLTGITTVKKCDVLGDAIADYGVKFGLVGTRANGGLTASTVLLAATWSDSGSADTFPQVDSTNDFDGVVLTLVIEGN